MFRMNSNYHYYEGPSWEPYNNYYAGFGERQMKRFHTALHHAAYFYNLFHSAIKARERESIEISDAEHELHEFARMMTVKVVKFRDDIFKFHKTTEKGEARSGNFEYDFMKQYKSDRWIKPVEVLENQKYVRFVNGLGYGEREEFFPTAKDQMSIAKSEFYSFTFWAHWLDYLLNGLFEGDGDNGTDDFDLGELNSFLNDCTKYLELVKKVDYLVDPKKEHYSEVAKK